MFGVIIKKTELSEMFPGMKTAEINEGHKVPGYSKFSINVSLNYVFLFNASLYRACTGISGSVMVGPDT